PDPPLVEDAPELEQRGAIRLQRLARQAPLELEVGQEVEQQLLEATSSDRFRDRSHRCMASAALPASLDGARSPSAETGAEPEQAHEALGVLALRDRLVEPIERHLDHLDPLVLLAVRLSVVEVGGEVEVHPLVGEAG